MIGEPMSGKTRAVNLLAECLTTLAEMKIPEQHEFKVIIDGADGNYKIDKYD